MLKPSICWTWPGLLGPEELENITCSPEVSQESSRVDALWEEVDSLEVCGYKESDVMNKYE